MLELLVHIPVLILVVIDLWMHYQHHRKKRKARVQLYTLDEARVILFKEALDFGRPTGDSKGINPDGSIAINYRGPEQDLRFTDAKF